MTITVVTRVDWNGSGEDTFVVGAFINKESLDAFMKDAPYKDSPDSRYDFNDFEVPREDEVDFYNTIYQSLQR